RHVSPRERHEGLVAAIAFESGVKLGALLMIAAIAVFFVFDGFAGIGNWLSAHPEALDSLYPPLPQGPGRPPLLRARGARFLLPRQFHMAFTERLDERAMHVASWAFPLFLLLLNLAVPAILWAGMQLLPDGNADFYVLTVARHSGSTLLSGIAFLGGLS